MSKELWQQGEHTWVADPNACPKSIPIIPPVSMLTMKLFRCLSPMPRIQWLMHIRAWELAKWERSARKASGPVLIFRKARLREGDMISVVSAIPPTGLYSQKDTYFKRSAGTLLSLLLKDVTVSERLAALWFNNRKCLIRANFCDLRFKI